MRQKKNSKRIKRKKSPFAKLFRKKSLLEAALTHPSNNETKFRKTQNYFERLEFLGDAVLGFIISYKLFDDYPKAREGKLSSLKAHWVSRKELARRALKIKLDKWIQTSARENRENMNPKILADSLEALIGALYLDRGIKQAEKFVRKLFPGKKVLAADEEKVKNPKGKLQELVQKKWKSLPCYITKKHKKGFHTTCKIPSGLAVGIGKNKKESQEAAAAKLVPRLVKYLKKSGCC